MRVRCKTTGEVFEINEKYFLSDKMIAGFLAHGERHNEKGTGFAWEPKDEDGITNALRANAALCPTDNSIKVGFINQDTQASSVFSEDGTSPTLSAGTHGYAQGYVQVKSATSQGYEVDPLIGAIRGRNPTNPLSRVSGLPTEQMLEINENGTSNALTTVQKDNVVIIPANNSKGYDIAEEEKDSINFSNPNSETRRGRVGKGVSQTLDTACNQGILTNNLLNTYKNTNFDGILKSIDNEKRNTAKVLLMLQQEIGKTAIETWGLRILETIRKEEVLRQGVHEESLFGEGEEAAVKVDKKIQQSKSTGTFTEVLMRSLPEETWERCPPQRRESIKQLIKELNESLQVMSHENPQAESSLQSGELRNESEGIRILREALSEVQKVRKPVNGKKQSIYSNYRIRRLTPREAFRLMDFDESFKFVVSNSQLYKQAGNSICVGVLAAIIKNFNLK